ncbi:MAG: ribonuclease J, partial [Microthrixaceae bacterium]
GGKIGIARGRIEEAGLLGRTELNVVADGKRTQVGPFELEFLPVTHSVPEGVATIIRTAQGVVMHSGDIKIDLTPVDGRLTDLTRMGAIADDEGIRLLLADSTNAEERGHSRSESSIGSVLYDLMHEHEGRRVITACFASHIHRIQQIADAAVAHGRKVAPLGRSMLRNVAMAREMGLLNISDSSIIDIEDVDDLQPGEVCVICTGSQGEPMSALTRLSQSENRFLKLTPHDTIILSSHPIPGNEHDVSRVIGSLIKQGAEVVHSGLHDVHATGHAKAEELKLLQSVLQPEWFVPVHGEYRHMVAHANLAVTMGRPRDHVLVAEDGDRLLLDAEGLRFDGRVPSEYIYVHGTVGDIGHGVLADRRILADDGMVTVIAVVDRKRGKIVAGPEVATRGWIVTEESGELIADLSDEVESALRDALDSDAEVSKLTKAVRRAAGSFVSKRTRRRPMIVPVVLEA